MQQETQKTEPIITVDAVGFTYPVAEGAPAERAALVDVSLTVAPGEFIAVLGHNGSGKSTLARHLNALLLPTEGAVWVRGMNTADEELLWEIRAACGMVFQNPDNQLVATVVEDDVAFGPENIGVPREEIRRRVDDALETVHMSTHALKAPHMLSGGQKQRVAIAGVLALHPQIVVMDEPTAMLDPHGRRQVMRTMEKLRAEGITVVLITHFMEEAARADRVVVMEDGKVVLQGTPREVFAHRAELKALGLDVPPMAELAGELAEAGIEIKADILSVEEMAEAVWQLYSKA